MPDPQRRAPRPSLQQLLWHCLMGVALGVLCAGLLLQVPSSAGDSLIAGPENSYKTLRFLLSFAFLFGLGATLTGAMFLSHDKS
jgi:NhaP-type Na+/H+ or K+/H+ antiporter